MSALDPTLIRRPDEWVEALERARAAGGRVGLVPTMGALHGGHLSLIRRAAAACTTVAVTVYVNPLQFAAGEDLDRYPRDLDADRAAAGGAGAHLVFAPSQEELWTSPPCTVVHVAGLSDTWEGRSRPGHFDGVATVVAKLLGLAGRCEAFFGEKDFQQLAVIRRLVADLSLPVTVTAAPTVRDPDGLALSSRNAYLSPDERAAAPALYAALLAGRRVVEEDRATDPAVVTAAMRRVLDAGAHVRADYAAAVDPDDLRPPDRLAGELRLLVAAWVGRTRLIDNLPATSPHPPAGRAGAAEA